MHLGPLRTRSAAAALALLLAAPLSGCGADPPPPDAAALRRRFPAQAAEILDRTEPLVAVEGGFALRAAGGGAARAALRPGGLSAELPRRGEGAVVFRLEGGAGRAGNADGADGSAAPRSAGLEVHVRELGATGEGAVAGSAVAYARPGGTSYWTATERGYEEWLLLEEGAAAGDRPVATWEVDGAAPRQRGAVVELCDEGGTPRLRVTAPRAYAAGGRPVEARLAARGGTIELWVDAGGEAVLVDPAWTVAAPIGTPRGNHSATLLGNGQVLVAGGIAADTNDRTPSAELYDPVGDVWRPAGSMATAQALHTATLLANGQVLAAGGGGDTIDPTGTQLYDPASDAWSIAAPMRRARVLHTATRLRNGEVLVVGGDSSAVDPGTAELYDPETGTWMPTGPTVLSRRGHSATLLANGKALVAGGMASRTGVSTTTAELYDPATRTWTAAGSLAMARGRHAAALLGNGQVLVAGGSDDGRVHTSVELYDPARDAWTAGAPMSAARFGHTATRLGNGQVLVAGGNGAAGIFSSAELYDPVRDTWISAGTMSMAHGYDATVTLLGDGRVLVVGDAVAELFSPLPLGAACALPGECQTGFCADGVCCATACDAGPCDACSRAQGSPSDGACEPLTGPACDDGNACTRADTCQVGACTGADPRVCRAPDTCRDAVCDPGTGDCIDAARADGAACDDGDACTDGDTCLGGACAGSPRKCPPADECHEPGTCDPRTGRCSTPLKPECGPDDAGGAGLAPTVPPDVRLCAAQDECPDGQYCVDSVCCDTTCAGPCHSCALPGHMGVCTLEPPGVDLREDCGSAKDCLRTCGPDGACIGAHEGAQCTASRCTGASEGVGPAYCAKVGDPCPSGDGVPFDCGRYRCAPAFGACLTRCQSVHDCAPGSVCDPEGACVRPPDRTPGEDAGCSLAARAPDGRGAGWLAAGLLAAAAAMGRSRRAALRRSRPAASRRSPCSARRGPLPGLRAASRGARRLLLLLLAAAAGVLLGCGAEPAPPGAAALRGRFPAQEAEILERREALIATAEGFGARPDARGEEFSLRRRGGLRADLPRRGEDALRFRLAGGADPAGRGAAGSDGFEVHVRELGASGEGTVAGSAVAYVRPGGTSYWTATAGGYEEWLLLEQGVAFRDRPAAEWTIAGAALRQRGAAVELCDEGGSARLRVTAPRAYAAGGRPVEARLAARGARIELWVDVDGEAVLVDPAWTAAGMLPAGHASQTATLLGNGQVLVAGAKESGVIDMSDLYDPESGTWTPAASMRTARFGAAAVRLGDGQVLVTGGIDVSVERYDPESDSWADAASMGWPRMDHTATLLGDGRVFTAGGYNGGANFETAEIYDPASDTWLVVAPMSEGRSKHTATRLANGQVLVAGGLLTGGPGVGDAPLSSAEVYDPAGNVWYLANMPERRSEHTATLLANGQVLVAGGVAQAVLGSADLYDPVTGWRSAAPMLQRRRQHTATLLASGHVLVVGGRTEGDGYLASAELYDPARDAWIPAGSMAEPRGAHAATRLGDGRVLIAGGGNEVPLVPLATTELFRPLPLGAACTQPGECQTGFCADGFCCTTACEGPCEACDDAESGRLVGVCGPVGDGAACDDHNACTRSDTCQGGACLGSDPVLCAAPDACHDGVCDPATGECQFPVTPECAPGELDGTAPATPASIPAGIQTCTVTTDCAGGSFCVSGVCCDAPCTDLCTSCVLPGHVGRCMPEPTGVDLHQDCGAEGTCLSTCGPGGRCIGAGPGTQCAASRCTDESHGEGPAFCPSHGAACATSHRVAFDCGSYRCAPALGACYSSCLSVAECAPGWVCDPGGRCVQPPEIAVGSDPGCSAAAGRAGGAAGRWTAALLAAGALALRRPRRRRRAPAGPR
ncbi:uncharacterized protein SOCE26_031090 [Sorangium cellulosum]|uniref:Disintegrin domain-containing protein n=1 Tax=Sorangium cellulosum TaxID=56 RepID=A0A2L0EQU8_SORCE|nr:kelch repeat-containing protein [Sorangium cellulosum]AUX41687.1 uncharacterized protein SOCE26_031090 [Sorangium cellulosum]